MKSLSTIFLTYLICPSTMMVSNMPFSTSSNAIANAFRVDATLKVNFPLTWIVLHIMVNNVATFINCNYLLSLPLLFTPYQLSLQALKVVEMSDNASHSYIQWVRFVFKLCHEISSSFVISYYYLCFILCKVLSFDVMIDMSHYETMYIVSLMFCMVEPIDTPWMKSKKSLFNINFWSFWNFFEGIVI